jgi:hypothetical protein
MKPIPYKSMWTEKTHYLIKTIHHNDIAYAVVPNGVQARDGHIFLSHRDACSWLKENGFELVEAKSV